MLAVAEALDSRFGLLRGPSPQGLLILLESCLPLPFAVEHVAQPHECHALALQAPPVHRKPWFDPTTSSQQFQAGLHCSLYQNMWQAELEGASPPSPRKRSHNLGGRGCAAGEWRILAGLNTSV